MSNTTNLFELPDKQSETQPSTNMPSLDPTTINSLVNGLHEISESGLTQLPSRDIPMNTDQIMLDEKLQPNYIPSTPNTNYIPHQDLSNIVMKEKKNHLLDDYFSEFHSTFILIILYFIFQLPIIKNKLYLFLPVLFKHDHNYNLKGLIFMSVVFGFCYYLLMKTIELGNYF